MANQHSSSKRIATLGIYFAIVIVAFNLDSLLSLLLPIKFAIISIAIVSTLVLLSKNFFEAAIIGAFFGLASLISQWYLPKVPAFLNPLCSVLPRIFVGLGTFGAYKLMFLIFKKITAIKRRYFSAMFAGGSAAIINTVLVMLALSIYKNDSYLTMIKAILLTNFLPEFIGGMILVPLITLGVSKGAHMTIAGEHLLDT
ncbi:MAG: hypothetical protein RR316_02880 [Clostridia bacterium]